MLNLSQDKIIEILLDVNFWRWMPHPLCPSLEVSSVAKM